MAEGIANSAIPDIQTDLTIAPYLDDYAPEKNYKKILFVPSLAVQARELTQLQTNIQRDLAAVGSHLFREGAQIKGCAWNLDTSAKYIRLADLNSFGNTVFVDNFANTLITGTNANVQAVVVQIADGQEAEFPDTKTLVIKYTKSSANGTVKEFSPGEIITSNNAGFTATILAANTATGNATYLTMDNGVLFLKGFPITFVANSITVDKYSNKTTKKVGIQSTESIITTTQDNTLADPSIGSPNYAAPGAHRLKIDAQLAVYGAADSIPNNFIEIVSIKDGIIQNATVRTEYNDLMDELAFRTYQESGDYVVNGFKTKIQEHLDTGQNNGFAPEADGGNNFLLNVKIEPGLAFVRGYDIEYRVSRDTAIDKAIDFVDVESGQIATNYANYLMVNEHVGNFDFNGGAQVTLYDAPQRRITTKEYSSVGSPTGNNIGTARVKAIGLDSGNPGANTAQYRLYLYDIQLSNSKPFSNVKSVFYSDSNARAFADAVSPPTQPVDSNFDIGIFRIPSNAIRRLRDSSGQVETSFSFIKSFDVTAALDGTFSVSTGNADERYPYAVGALSDTQKDDNFHVVFNDAVQANLSGTITTVAGNSKFTGVGTSFTTELRVGEKINVGNSTIYRVASITNSTFLTVEEATIVNAAANTFGKQYLEGEVLDLVSNGVSNVERSVTIASATSASFELKENFHAIPSLRVTTRLNKVNAKEKAKTLRRNRYVIIDTTTHPNLAAGPWSIGVSDLYILSEIRASASAFSGPTDGSDVTINFKPDTGQTDTIYNLASISKINPDYTPPRYLLVKFDYFLHDTSQGAGYFAVDSYPVDDSQPASSTTILTENIPVYSSLSTGQLYSLRDCIDIRSSMTQTATDATTVGAATTNPSSSSSLTSVSGGLHTSWPDETFTFDYSFYLSRKDLVYVDRYGNQGVVRGIPRATLPITPATPDNTMATATVEIPPFPSQAKTVKITQLTNRRYTMKDIGTLDQRITNLEYYVTLNTLEKDTKDLLILDENGLDRFKNGFIVDPFTGSAVGDPNNFEYACSIDSVERELRPRAIINNIDLVWDDAVSNNIVRNASDATLIVVNANNFTIGETIFQGANLGTATGTGVLVAKASGKLYLEQTTGVFSSGLDAKGASSSTTSSTNTVINPIAGDYLMLPYTHTLFYSQPLASTTRNASGLFWNWKGSVILYPDTDYWVDIVNAPDVVINPFGENDNWLQPTGWETSWGSWENVWTGISQSVAHIDLSNGAARAAFLLSSQADTVINGIVNAQQRAQWQGIMNQARAWAAQGLNVAAMLKNTPTGFNTATATSTTVQQRAGTQTRTTFTAQNEVVGDFLIDSSLLPYMRARPVLFTARGLKPSTKFYAFFDGVSVSQFCAPIQGFNFNNTEIIIANTTIYIPTSALPNRPATVEIPPRATGSVLPSLGADLLTDANGDLVGIFYLPSSDVRRFTVGNKLFRLTDNLTNATEIGLVTSAAEAQYSASGLKNTQTTLSVTTRVAHTETRAISEQQVVQGPSTTSTLVFDPIAYSFPIEVPNETVSGIFISKINLYFAGKHATLPCEISLREVDETTLEISPRTVPGSKVLLNASDINVSADSSVPTPISFPSPIFLKRGSSVAVRVAPGGSNPDVLMWVGKLGATDLTSNTRITQRTTPGIMYVSSNDRKYSAVQDEFLKCDVFRANFSFVTGTARLSNKDSEYFVMNTYPTGTYQTGGEPIYGEPKLTLNVITGNTANGLSVTGALSNTSGIVVNVTGNTYQIRGVAAGETFEAGETLTFFHANGDPSGGTGNVFSIAIPGGIQYHAKDTLQLVDVVNVDFTVGETLTGQFSNNVDYIVGFAKLQLNTHRPIISTLSFPDTFAGWEARLVSNSAVQGSFLPITIDGNNDTDFEKSVYSASQEAALLSGEKSYQLRGTLRTDNGFVSPVIDVRRMGSIIIGNDINNDDTDEAGSLFFGNSHCRYITKVVTLNDGQDAEDINLFITAYKPAGTRIQAYYKIRNAEDSDVFESKVWTQLENISNTAISDTANKSDFKELNYKIADAELTGPNGEVQYVNSEGITFTGYKQIMLKVVLLSENTSLPPRGKDLRGICLQI